VSQRAIILFAHGARDPEWAAPFRKIRRAVARRSPGTAVELAFLESMDPPLADAIGKLAKGGCKQITIAPLFMAQGGHLKQDVPRILDAIRAEHKAMEIKLLPAIGEVDPVLDAISSWVAQAAAS